MNFTNAKAEEETYVRLFPEDLFPGDKAVTIARLKRSLYGSKLAPKLWYNCLYQVQVTNLDSSQLLAIHAYSLVSPEGEEKPLSL